MTEYMRLDIPVLLPGVEDEQDECVARLIALLERRDGVEKVHVARPSDRNLAEHGKASVASPPVSQSAQLCLHYDPERMTLAKIQEIALQAGAGVSRRYGHDIVPFRAVGAEDEGRRIEESIRAIHGVTSATVNFPGQVLRVEYDREAVQLPAILARLTELGVSKDRDVSPLPAAREEAEKGWYGRNQELAWSLIAGGLTLLAWGLERAGAVPRSVAIGIFVAAYFFGSRDNIGHLIKDIRRGRFHFNIDLLMVVAAVGAAILGAWAEGALLLFLFSLGHALEHYAMGRARNAIKALAELAPQTAIVRRNGVDTSVPISDVKPDDLVVVKPAERIAVDGVVAEGRSAVNQAPITGESVPVEKSSSDKVFAGSVNGDGALVIRVTAAIGDRTLDRVIALVADAGTQKAPTQQFTDRFQRVFVPLVLVLDVLVIVLPPLVGMWTWSESFYRGMALLVAASPCALALGTPAAVLAGIAQAARNGVLIKGGAHLEALGAIDVLALDKTGTITVGEPAMVDIVVGDGTDEANLLSTAAAVERHSQHPVARAVVAAADVRRLPLPDAADLQSITGRGVSASVHGTRIDIGRIGLFDDPADAPPQQIRDAVARMEAAGQTAIVVRARNATPAWLGVIGVADTPREGVRETLDRLRATGIKRIVMLTGDNVGVGKAIGDAVGLTEVRAQLMPEDKVQAIRELEKEGRVAMVGDGVNDAPALAHATVGIAMGGAGTAAALETADVALMGDDLSRLPFAIGLSRTARGVIRQNLFVSLAVILVLAIATVGGFARIGPAVIAHEGSTLVVIANALRLLRYRGA